MSTFPQANLPLSSGTMICNGFFNGGSFKLKALVDVNFFKEKMISDPNIPSVASNQCGGVQLLDVTKLESTTIPTSLLACDY
jgi:hypothetical protein